MKRRMVLLGPPASGKGTQAEMIEKRYGIPTASPGEMLRMEKAAGTTLGLEADRLTRMGHLLPDETINSLVSAWFQRNDGAFVLDGYPRTIAQADALGEMLNDREMPLEAVILLNADEEMLRKRVASRLVCSQCRRIVSVGLHVKSFESTCPACEGALVRRSDDTPETLAFRLREYADKTAPLIEYYASRGCLFPVDANGNPDKVFESIAKILERE